MRLLLLVIALLPGSAYADDKIYEWLLKQYEGKNVTVIDSQSVGLIDGEEHLALVARDIDEKRDADTSGKKQYLGLFKQSQGKLVGIALARLADVGGQEYPRAEIRNNSIFLTTTYCHHGCYYHRYQFNNIGGQLKLAGFESLFDTTFAEYAGIENYLVYCANRSDCGSVASGNSYNYLSSTSICWLEIVPDERPDSKRPYPFQPRGVQHKMPFKKASLQLLDGFDTEKYFPPKSCYFDYKKKLHASNP